MFKNKCQHTVTSMFQTSHFDWDRDEEVNITIVLCDDCNKRVY